MTVLTKIATGLIWSFQLTMTAMDLMKMKIAMIQMRLFIREHQRLRMTVLTKTAMGLTS